MNPTFASIFGGLPEPVAGARFRKSSLARERDMNMKRAKAISQREKMKKHNRKEKARNRNWGKR